jgi:sterol desaturase/sphingolipid hydroxylase (fatty acid hydroxylase superfamily)
MSDYVLTLLRGAYFGTLVGGFIFFLMWEGGAPRRSFAGDADRRRHVLRNFGLFVSVVLIADIAVGMVLFDASRWIARSPGTLLGGLDGWWPLQLAAGIVAIDFLYYWWHRASHAVPLLWRIHRVHHSDPHLDVTTGTRFHPLEVSISIGLVIVVLNALGIPLWVELARTLVVNPLVMAQHANVAFPARWDALLRPLIVTPELHRVHHSPLRAEHDANYGQIFSCWDRWFGTLRPPPASVAEVGVAGLESARWQTVAGMLATPFR